MSCRQAQTIDLAGFLENPRSAPFDAFRAHYPRCVECSSEVRVWTELHLQLLGATRHPTAEQLLAHEEERLPSAAALALSRHLADCAVCRDEIEALRRFAGAPLTRDESASRLAAFGSGLRRLLWHPAFAYALVGLLLFPALWMTLGDGRDTAFRAPASPPAEERAAPADAQAEAPEPEARTRPAVAPPLRSEPAPAGPRLAAREMVRPPEAEESVRPQAKLEGRLESAPGARVGEQTHSFTRERRAKPSAAAPAPAPGLASHASGVSDERGEAASEAGAPPELPVTARREQAALAGGFESLHAAQAPMRQEVAAEPSFGTTLRAHEASRAAAATSAEGRVSVANGGGPRPALDLAPDGNTVVTASDAASVERLVVPIGPRASAWTASLYLADASERRVLREEIRIEAGASTLEVALPEGWLRVGRYVVEVRANSTEEPQRSSLEVKEP